MFSYCFPKAVVSCWMWVSNGSVFSYCLLMKCQPKALTHAPWLYVTVPRGSLLKAHSPSDVEYMWGSHPFKRQSWLNLHSVPGRKRRHTHTHPDKHTHPICLTLGWIGADAGWETRVLFCFFKRACLCVPAHLVHFWCVSALLSASCTGRFFSLPDVQQLS